MYLRQNFLFLIERMYVLICFIFQKFPIMFVVDLTQVYFSIDGGCFILRGKIEENPALGHRKFKREGKTDTKFGYNFVK